MGKGTLHLKLPDKIIPDITCGEASAIAEALEKGNEDDFIVFAVHCGRKEITHDENCPALKGRDILRKVQERIARS